MLGNYEFVNLGQPEFVIDDQGMPAQLRPQDRFTNLKRLNKHKYGDLEYCKFRVPGLPHSPGIYAFVSGNQVLYIGKASSIAQRFMPGYRLISPRMCFEGGPQTTCRINSELLSRARRGETPSILVYETADFHDVEAELISLYQPAWNRAGVQS